MTPNKLPRSTISQIYGDTLTALIAFRLGRADSDHYHKVASALLIAQAIAESVPRHRKLLVDIREALDALNGVFQRAIDNGDPGGQWSATTGEMDSMEFGAEIAKALLMTTPGPAVRRAIMAAMRLVESGETPSCAA